AGQRRRLERDHGDQKLRRRTGSSRWGSYRPIWWGQSTARAATVLCRSGSTHHNLWLCVAQPFVYSTWPPDPPKTLERVWRTTIGANAWISPSTGLSSATATAIRSGLTGCTRRWNPIDPRSASSVPRPPAVRYPSD